MMETSKFILVGLVLTICAFILQLIGLASPYWVTSNNDTFRYNLGLWKQCTDIVQSKTTTCEDVSDLKDWSRAVRAMSIMGLVSLLVSLIMTVLRLFVMKENKNLQFVAIGSAFAGAIFILISIAVYAAKIHDSIPTLKLHYHFAFAFCIIAMLAAIGAGCIMLADVIRNIFHQCLQILIKA